MQDNLGALELCLRIRSDGGRCVVVPQVVVTDESDPQPTTDQQNSFVNRWGFDWRVADLEAVQNRHAHTGLLWNVRYHSQAMPFEKYVDRPAVHWDNYQKVEVYRKRADHLTQLAYRFCPKGSVVDLGCGDGLFSHLLALRGAHVTGIDPEALAIDQARAATARLTYPVGSPQFIVGSGDSLPVPADSVNLVTLLDVIEHLPNPVAALREAARVLAPGGSLLVTTPAWQYGGWSDPVYHVAEYTPEELVRQIEVASGMKVVNTGKIGGVYRDLIVIAQKEA